MENNYQLSRIHNYVHGLMNPDEMHALEREALDDPFLQDAIDGYRLQNGVDAKQLSLLQQRLATRVEQQSNTRKKQFYSWQRLAIGMAAGVLFVSVCTLILMRYLPQQKNTELQEVVMNEHAYEYVIVPFPESDALPKGGWGAIYEKLNKSYSNANKYQGTLIISFTVNDGKATDLNIKGDRFLEDEELEDLLRSKISWEGSVGQFQLHISSLEM